MLRFAAILELSLHAVRFPRNLVLRDTLIATKREQQGEGGGEGVKSGLRNYMQTSKM